MQYRSSTVPGGDLRRARLRFVKGALVDAAPCGIRLLAIYEEAAQESPMRQAYFDPPRFLRATGRTLAAG